MLPCFCDAWPKVVYSPSPIFPSAILQRLLRKDAELNSIFYAESSWVLPLLTPSSSSSSTPTPKEAQIYLNNQPRLIVDMFNALLEAVPREVYDSLPKGSYCPHLKSCSENPPTSSSSATVWPPYWRLRDCPRWGEFPGLRSALATRKGQGFGAGLEAEEFFSLLDRGACTGGMEMRIINDRSHVLLRCGDVGSGAGASPPGSGGRGGGSPVGVFAKADFPPGRALGLFSGMLATLCDLDPYLSTLSMEDQKLAWSYDIESGIKELTFHGAGARNIMAGINDFHGITSEATVCKFPVKLGGILPLVVFVTQRPVCAGSEMTLNYGPAWVKTFCKYHPSARDLFQTAYNPDPSMLELMLTFGLSRADRTRGRIKLHSQEELMNKVNSGLKSISDAAAAAAAAAASAAAAHSRGDGGSTSSSINATTLPYFAPPSPGAPAPNLQPSHHKMFGIPGNSSDLTASASPSSLPEPNAGVAAAAATDHGDFGNPQFLGAGSNCSSCPLWGTAGTHSLLLARSVAWEKQNALLARERELLEECAGTAAPSSKRVKKSAGGRGLKVEENEEHALPTGSSLCGARKPTKDSSNNKNNKKRKLVEGDSSVHDAQTSPPQPPQAPKQEYSGSAWGRGWSYVSADMEKVEEEQKVIEAAAFAALPRSIKQLLKDFPPSERIAYIRKHLAQSEINAAAAAATIAPPPPLADL